MKNQITRILAIGLVLAVLAGCASWDAHNEESLLTAAGFRTIVPTTARQRELYAAAPAYRVQHGIARGKIFYTYKDERKGLVYTGGPAEYQRYQQLAIQQRIARDYYDAAAMHRDVAFGWYGAWGPRDILWW